MYNKLSWTNPNGATSITVKIYRGTSPLDRANLTGLLATLSAGETTYTDNTALRGVTYYYVFETISATDRTVSPNYPIVTVPRRGAGSNVLKAGDFNYGYFGSLPSSSFININALRAAVNFLLGTVQNVSPKWHKFARNGKVIYVPEQLPVNQITWTQLYNAGLVFGSNDNGPYNAGANVNQNAQVTIGPDTYRVRLMRGYNDDYNVFAPTTNVAEPAEAFTCEWDDFMYPLSVWVPGVQRMANQASLSLSAMGLGASISNGGVLMQEKCTSAASSTPLIRGSSITSARDGLTRRCVAATTIGTSTNVCWWPVLELIEPAAV
jgi:hypothetical protein